MVYESYGAVPTRQKPRTFIKKFAKQNEQNLTKAEKQFEIFLGNLNSGAIREKFVRQYIFSPKWILDFFFPEIRLGIEIDGSFHETPEQIKKDKRKNIDARKFEITLLRITNSEVFGNTSNLTQKMRKAWRMALDGKRGIIEPATSRQLGHLHTDKIQKNNRKRLILMTCQKCGHTKKAMLVVSSPHKRYLCSRCGAVGKASVLD